uniref:CSON010889 protein n=1 Tax=Culicoides sonorensis TaxID=179676 RepID=A0A336M6D4_CULSO
MLRNPRNLFLIGRNFHSGTVLKEKRNIGLKHRVKLAKQDPKSVVELYDEDPEFDPDSDFLESDKSHRKYQEEMKDYKEKLGNWIVRDKYFKQKSPNFLTWAEKEHIRYLHQEDPEEWNVKNLSDSFPIDIHHIKKLLRNKWTPHDKTRVEKHDLAVKQNWEKLRNGDFDEIISEKLKNHLMKFKDRKINLEALPKFEPRRRLSAGFKTKNNDFLSIITSCKKYQEKESTVTNQIEDSHTNQSNKLQIESRKLNPDNTNDSIMLRHDDSHFDTNRRMTLTELKRYLGENDEPETIELDEKQLELHSIENPSGTGISPKQKFENSVANSIPNKFESRIASQKILPELCVPAVQEKIKIPKKLWKRNATYKLRDCFYNDDGRLLYRVPGLTK